MLLWLFSCVTVWYIPSFLILLLNNHICPYRITIQFRSILGFFFLPRFGKINHMYMHLTVYYQFFPIFKLEKREGVVHPQAILKISSGTTILVHQEQLYLYPIFSLSIAWYLFPRILHCRLSPIIQILLRFSLPSLQKNVSSPKFNLNARQGGDWCIRISVGLPSIF